jgi:hypothetical protein
MEPATQAQFKKPTLCSLSHGKEKNTSESLEIQRGLHDISVLTTLFVLTTLKSTMIDLLDHLHYLTYLSLSGVSTKQFAMQCLYWYGGQCIFGMNHCWPRQTDAPWESPQKKSFCSTLYCQGVDVNIEYICVYDNTRPTNNSHSL